MPKATLFLAALVLACCVTVPVEQPTITPPDDIFTMELPPMPPDETIVEVAMPQPIMIKPSDKPYLDKFGFKVYRQPFTIDGAMAFRQMYNTTINNRWWQEVITFPHDGRDNMQARMLGAPTQLKCLKPNSKPSYDCSVIDIIMVDGVVHLVTRFHLYRYDPARNFDEKFVFVGSFPKMLTPYEHNGVILAVDMMKAAGLVYSLSGSWHYQELARKDQLAIKKIERVSPERVQLTSPTGKQIMVQLKPTTKPDTSLASIGR